MRWKTLAMFCSAVLAASPAGAQSVKAGITAWQQGDYARAMSIWRPLAEKGDADASFNLAQAYRLGRGVAVNLPAAQSWLRRAAAKGHVDAQTTLGLLMFENGDRGDALRWLKAAADKGEPRALLIYGTAMFNGDGVKRDRVMAYAYVSRAAAQGLGPAKETLAEMDAIIPLAERKKGVAIALSKATATKGASAKSVAKAPAKASLNSVEVAAPASVTTVGGWRIQLGAFSKRSSAEALFGRLSAKPPVAGKQMALVAAGPITRLQVGPFSSRSSAAAACAALAKAGQACFPVPAK